MSAPASKYKKSNEPFWWSLFGAGGMVAALLMPVAVVLTGILVPAGWLSQAKLLELIHHPIGRLYLFALISLPLFHWAHRFRFTLMDLGLKRIGGLLGVFFYGAAFAGTAMGAWYLVRL
ncbi:MAG TPA: fumarate reductase subunit FrdD [Polyangiaceae bacterium]|jgi:fumarate reductase subunit D